MPNQGFFFRGGGGVEMGAEQRYKARRGTIILISHTLYHFKAKIFIKIVVVYQDPLTNSIYN